MPEPLTSIRNIGPATAAELERAGITNAEQFYQIGADAAYQRMLASGSRPHFIAYYVLHMAHQGRPWNDCTKDEKATLKRAFDQLKQNTQPSDTHIPHGLNSFLNTFGFHTASK